MGRVQQEGRQCADRWQQWPRRLLPAQWHRVLTGSTAVCIYRAMSAQLMGRVQWEGRQRADRWQQRPQCLPAQCVDWINCNVRLSCHKCPTHGQRCSSRGSDVPNGHNNCCATLHWEFCLAPTAAAASPPPPAVYHSGPATTCVCGVQSTIILGTCVRGVLVLGLAWFACCTFS